MSHCRPIALVHQFISVVDDVQLLESYAPKRKQSYGIYIGAGLSGVKDSLGISAYELAECMLRGVVCPHINHCVHSCPYTLTVTVVHLQSVAFYKRPPSHPDGRQMSPTEYAERHLTPEATVPEEVLKGASGSQPRHAHAHIPVFTHTRTHLHSWTQARTCIHARTDMFVITHLDTHVGSPL